MDKKTKRLALSLLTSTVILAMILMESRENPATIRGWLRAAMMWLVSPAK